MRRPPRSVLVGVAALVGVLVTATVVRSCSGPDTTITVYADSSLRHAFADLGRAFEDEHDVVVEVRSGAAGDLTAAMADGASPDVFAAGDPTTLVQINGSLTGEPRVIAEDHLVIAVPADNRAGIDGVTDLEANDVAVCFINEPCGRLAQWALAAQGPDLAPRLAVAADSAQTMALVLDGTVDAGLVMATEARAAGDAVATVELPWAGYRVSYPAIALLDGAPHPDEAQEFIDFVLGDPGRGILADAGFTSADNPHLQPED